MCTFMSYEKDILGKIQNEAARMNTGLAKSVSVRNLYLEMEWPFLCDRRKFQKLVLMYKIYNIGCPGLSL